MAMSSQGNFDSLDLAELAEKQPRWCKLFGQESGSSAEKYSVSTQLLIGGVTGGGTGFIFQKVGKLAATAVGGGYFLLQLANHTGYIKVNQQRVEKDRKKAKKPLNVRKSYHLCMEMKSKAEGMVSFVKNVLVTGFLGGFLLGILRRMTYCFSVFQLAASSFHHRTSSLLFFLFFSCAFLPALAYLSGFCRHLLVKTDNGPTVSLMTMT